MRHYKKQVSISLPLVMFQKGTSMLKVVLIFPLVAFLFLWNQLYAGEFKLTSESFKNNSRIPAKFANYAMENGENISPQLSWDNPPQEVKSYAIVCIDTSPIANNWIHWAVFNIPSNVTSLSEGASCSNMPDGATELINSFVRKGYGGPQPPDNTGVHTYLFTIYALNTTKIASAKKMITYNDLKNLLLGKVIAEAALSGAFD